MRGWQGFKSHFLPNSSSRQISPKVTKVRKLRKSEKRTKDWKEFQIEEKILLIDVHQFFVPLVNWVHFMRTRLATECLIAKWSKALWCGYTWVGGISSNLNFCQILQTDRLDQRWQKSENSESRRKEPKLKRIQNWGENFAHWCKSVLCSSCKLGSFHENGIFMEYSYTKFFGNKRLFILMHLSTHNTIIRSITVFILNPLLVQIKLFNTFWIILMLNKFDSIWNQKHTKHRIIILDFKQCRYKVKQ